MQENQKMESKSDLSYYARGGCSSMIAISLTYPLNKLSMRQAMEGIGSRKAFFLLKKEGFFNLYKGLAPPLMQKSVNCAIMFGTYFSAKRILSSTRGYSECTDQQIVVASGLTSAILESLLTPFERVQTLLTCRTHSRYISNTYNAVRLIGKSQNPMKELYRGYTAVLLRNVFSTTLFFSAKECFISRNCRYNLSHMPNRLLRDFLEGALLGAICSTICFPINVTRFHMQRRLRSPFLSFAVALHDVVKRRDYNIKKFYSGAGVNIVRSFLSWGVVNSVFEQLAFLF